MKNLKKNIGKALPLLALALTAALYIVEQQNQKSIIREIVLEEIEKTGGENING